MEINVVYKEFNKVLYHYITKRVNNKEDAKDILQNVFIKISQHASSLSDEQKIKSWVYTITRNSIIDYYRTRTDTKLSDLSADLTEGLEEDRGIDHFHGLDACIALFIEQLPSEYRNIIIDSEINGIKQKELAEKYEMPYVSLRSRVQRGRERLKKMFMDCCHIELDSRGNILEATPRKACSDSSKTCS